MLHRERVPPGEHVVEESYHRRRWQALGQRREAGDVGEQDSDGFMRIGDHTLLALQARGDRGGQDVQQQALGPGVLASTCAHEVLEQHVGRRGHAQDGEPEEREHDAVRDVGRTGRDR